MHDRLWRLLASPELRALLSDLALGLGGSARITDPDGVEIAAFGLPAGQGRHQITAEDEVLGWVLGGKAASLLARLLSRLAREEREKRLLDQVGNAHRAAHERISDEIGLLAQLQGKMLPREPLAMPGMTARAVYIPSGLASGDAYDYFPVPGGRVRTMVADVAGHGARAAFVTAIVQTLFRTTRDMYLDLSDTFILINHRLRQIFVGESDFVTMFAADLDPGQGAMTFLNAGHCCGLLRAEGRLARLEAMTPPLGFFDLELTPARTALPPDWGLFLYTDGLYEWERPEGGFYGPDRFLELAADMVQRPDFRPEALLERLDAMGSRAARHDDATALWLTTA